MSDKKCAPGLKFEDGSCYKLAHLITMASLYNKQYPEKQIKIYSQKDETLYPRKYKLHLVKELTDRMSDICDDQQCWLDQPYLHSRLGKQYIDEIKQHTFRPKGPSGKFTWLSTNDIEKSLRQYHQKYSDFYFLGAVPLDFEEMDNYYSEGYDGVPKLYYKNLDFDELYKRGKKRIGIVINLDTHDKGGSHWVAVYVDMDKSQIYYFDSYGIKPPKRIGRFMINVSKYMINNLGKKVDDIDLGHNTLRHQYGGSECGVYSMSFILRMLRGDSFDTINRNKVTDSEVNQCRNVYFTIPKR